MGRTILPQRDLALLAENAFLRQQNAVQNERIEELENHLKKYENPHTLSSQQGGARQQPQNEKSEQDKENDEAGGGSSFGAGRNSGHEGITRPPPDPDRTVRAGEACCSECDRFLTDPDEYVSRVVIDIPLRIPTEVTEYELGKQECSCGNEVVAEHPDCPETGWFGPRLLAQTAFLRYHGRLTHRKQAELFDWQLDHPVSSGTIYNLTERVADRLRPAYEDVRASVRDSNVIYCDETGFPVDGDQHWVWTLVTDEDVLYMVNESRGSQVLEDVLGEFVAEDVTLSCDGWSAHPSYYRKLQRCWAHLLREGK